MTRTTNSKIAGFTFLAYIAAGITSMIVYGRATSGEGVAAKLAGIAQHPIEVGIVVDLGFIQAFAALILAVTLYAITREQDPDLAMLALTCRVTEGVIGGFSILRTPALVWLATATGVNAPDTVAAHALAAYLLRGDVAVTATFFAVGSTLFSYLLLRGRMIPVALAWLGVVASVLLVIGLPLQAAGFLRGPITSAMWLPMLLFEVPLAVWLIVKGAALSARFGFDETPSTVVR
ncbi:MAG: DUF4386 domain-containing protein [Terriglobia bacterium]|nr:MAG: DUF4386 domain-containing protein [Terriglobia bacterium]